MGLSQLVAAARGAGRDQAKAALYWVELHKRFALPAAALVFVLVGFPLGGCSHRGGRAGAGAGGVVLVVVGLPLGVCSQRGGRAVALASSFAVVVSYYVLSTSLEGPALNGRLPPGLAIWLPDLLFGLLGLGLLRAATVGVPAGWVKALWRLAARLETFRARWGGRSRAVRRPVRLRGLRASAFIIDRSLIRQYLLLLGIGLLVGGVVSLVVDLL